MLIVSDTTTITNLWQIGKIAILKNLYGKIVIPSAVWKELIVVPMQADYLEKNDWLEVRSPKNQNMVKELLEDLDLGEAEAITLSLELKADFLIIDEAIGRKKAQNLHIKVIGLLGILLKAKQENLIDQIKPILEELDTKVGFFINPALYKEVLKIAKE